CTKGTTDRSRTAPRPATAWTAGTARRARPATARGAARPGTCAGFSRIGVRSTGSERPPADTQRYGGGAARVARRSDYAPYGPVIGRPGGARGETKGGEALPET